MGSDSLLLFSRSRVRTLEAERRETDRANRPAMLSVLSEDETVSDFFEIDFLDVKSAKSGDAIALRYHLNGRTYIHVVDGGFQDTGDDLVNHIRQYYGNPTFIGCVVATT